MRPDVSHIGLAVDIGDGGSCSWKRPPLGGRTRLVIIIYLFIYSVMSHVCASIAVRCSCDVFGYHATLVDNGVSPNKFKAGTSKVDSLRRELASISYVMLCKFMPTVRGVVYSPAEPTVRGSKGQGDPLPLGK